MTILNQAQQTILFNITKAQRNGHSIMYAPYAVEPVDEAKLKRGSLIHLGELDCLNDHTEAVMSMHLSGYQTFSLKVRGTQYSIEGLT